MTRARVAVRLGAALVRLTGATAGALTAVFLVVGAIGLLAFEPVDEAVCDYDAARDECAGPEWTTFAVLGLVGGLAAVAAGRREERSERSRFEADWDRAVVQGAKMARPAPRRIG